MRQIESAVVASVVAGDAVTANDHLQHLVVHDRRRAWWALFRAAAQCPAPQRQELVALVGRAYIARRTGRLIGVGEDTLIEALTACLVAPRGDRCALSPDEQRLLVKWLPARLNRILWTA